jgi:hypothetical protein
MADSDVVYRYRSFVMGAVLSSVAFLEAKIAELRSDAEDGPFALSTTGLTPTQCDALRVALARPIRMLDLYQAALEALGRARFRAESGPLPQSALPLIERKLKRQFPSTKFAWAEQPFFPDHCLSAECARWAIESSLTFSQDFCA